MFEKIAFFDIKKTQKISKNKNQLTIIYNFVVSFWLLFIYIFCETNCNNLTLKNSTEFGVYNTKLKTQKNIVDFNFTLHVLRIIEVEMKRKYSCSISFFDFLLKGCAHLYELNFFSLTFGMVEQVFS